MQTILLLIIIIVKQKFLFISFFIYADQSLKLRVIKFYYLNYNLFHKTFLKSLITIQRFSIKDFFKGNIRVYPYRS